MNYVFIIVALVVVAFAGLIIFTRLSPTFMAQQGRSIVAVLLFVGALLALIANRIGVGFILFALALLFLFGRGGPWRGMSGSGRSRSAGRTSRVQSRYIRMDMEHSSGQLYGEVIEGAHKGQSLSSLTLEELLELRLVCEREDVEGAALLDAWLDAMHVGWRDGAGIGEDSAPAGAMAMDRATALDVLGLDEAANDDDIRDAHRQLMKKLHPDQGGSTYLATQINAAKDVLLGDEQ